MRRMQEAGVTPNMSTVRAMINQLMLEADTQRLGNFSALAASSDTEALLQRSTGELWNARARQAKKNMRTGGEDGFWAAWLVITCNKISKPRLKMAPTQNLHLRLCFALSTEKCWGVKLYTGLKCWGVSTKTLLEPSIQFNPPFHL